MLIQFDTRAKTGKAPRRKPAATDSPFIQKVRELERSNPYAIEVLERLVDGLNASLAANG